MLETNRLMYAMPMSVALTPGEKSDGKTAYVVVHALYRYKTHGVLTDEPAEMVFALQRGQGGWKDHCLVLYGHSAAPLGRQVCAALDSQKQLNSRLESQDRFYRRSRRCHHQLRVVAVNRRK